jgi:hypothetical protein
MRADSRPAARALASHAISARVVPLHRAFGIIPTCKPPRGLKKRAPRDVVRARRTFQLLNRQNLFALALDHLSVAGARYRLIPQAHGRVCQSLWFAELLLSAYMGQVEILGVWP